MPLALLLDAAGCDRKRKFTGTTLAYLRQRTTLDCIRNWEDELPFTTALCALSDATAVAPFITANYPPMPQERSVARQLQDGELSEFPLVALLARPVPRVGKDNELWLSALRTWCFIQFLWSRYGRASPSSYLVTVVNKLRQAIDEEGDWLDLFLRLHGTTDSFYALTRHLSGRANSLLSDTVTSVDRPSHRTMLTHLRNVCDGKEPDSSTDTKAPEYGLFAQYLQRQDSQSHWLNANDRSPPTREPAAELEADDLGTQAFDLPGSEPATMQVAGVDTANTPPEQERKANGVLLASIEDSQLLPFSWNRPNPEERRVLKRWLDEVWQGTDIARQELAAMIYLAIHCAYSLRTVLALQISSEPGEDWRLDLLAGALHRRPPRRYNGWRSTEQSDSWVAKRAEKITLPLPIAVQTALTHLIGGRSDVQILESVWEGRSAMPEQVFREVCQTTPGLERITSGMLARWLEQTTFERTSDPVLSQLLASHPRSGLPGACAYSSYGSQQVNIALRVSLAEPADEPRARPPAEPLNSAGSELSPLEPLVRQACADALAEVNQLATDPEQWARHHNALTAYLVVTLLACTGARPVNSPFESLEHFDFSRGRLYIEDKVSSRLHQGRLLPLPEAASTLVRDHYLPHLARLAQVLYPTDPRMSQACASLSRSEPVRSLPLFFLLSTVPELDWVEVSESSLSALGIFRWPLPWNLMRHRLPTELKRAGLDHEIVNGLTGHGEQGTAAYGPYSMRAWKQDAQKALPCLTQLLQRLNMDSPKPPSWPVAIAIRVAAPSQGSALNDAQDFGPRARHQRRQETHAKVREQARREIAQFVGSRPLESIAPEAWEQLSRAMLLTPTGMPQAMGTLRYDTFRQWLLDRWTAEGQKPRLKKRYLPALEEPSPFTELAVGAQPRWQSAQQLLQDHFATLVVSKTSMRDGLALGIASLLLQSRVADPTVLRDLSKGRNFRLVAFGDSAFLEHAPALDREPMAPCRRYRLGGTAAALLSRAKASRYGLDISERPVPTELVRIGQACGMHTSPETSTSHWIQAWWPLVQQCNQMHFPGLVAAYLNGQVVTAALHHADWLRGHLGFAVRVPAPDRFVPEQAPSEDAQDDAWIADADAESGGFAFMARELIASANSNVRHADNCDPKGDDDEAVRTAQQRCRVFFQAIRNALHRFAAQKHSPRRDLDAALRRVIAEHGDVSRSCRLLAEWLRSMLWRRTPRGQLSLSSLSRYLNALSVCFEAVAYRHDLLACDEDEVTSFYVQVMDARRTIRPDSDPLPKRSNTDQAADAATSKNAAASDRDAPYRTWHLAFQLLRNFHQLMSQELALEDPDWSEISPAQETLSISPGLILEQEYRHALALAAPSPATACHEELAVAFILLVAMRFGLRGAEVTGLMRSDWVDTSSGTTVVLVQNHQHRSLKTPAARRQVPLLFNLTEPERLIAQRFLALWEGIAGGDLRVPLFASSEDASQLLNDKPLRWQASQCIKLATLNPHLSLHHARHTFANRVALMLMDNTQGIWPCDSASEHDADRSTHVRKLLLCTDQVTRRSLWALARVLGHAHPQTSVRSYLHLLPELADRYVWADASRAVSPIPRSAVGIVQLNGLAAMEGYLSAPARPEQLPAHPPSPQELVRLLHLYQQGAALERAAFSAAVPLTKATRLVNMVKQVDGILARRTKINPHRGGASNLLSHIRQPRWQWLVQKAGDLQPTLHTETTGKWAEPEDLLNMIGPSRQILLYQRRHFAVMQQVLTMWRLPLECVRTIITRGQHAQLLQWAEEFDLSIQPPHAKGQSAIQIDSLEVGDPPASIKHRCAMVFIAGPGQQLESSFEMVLLVLLSIYLLGSAYGAAALQTDDTMSTNA